MDIVERVKGILLSPKTEWPKIAAEPMTAQQIYTNWVLILAAIGPIATLIGSGITFGFGFSIRLAIAAYVMMLVMVAIVALVIDLLAPQFGGTKDFVAALKLAAFSFTAAFVGGIFHLLAWFGGVLYIIVALYSWYLLFLGAPVLRKATPDKALVFTIAVAVVGLLVGWIFGSVTMMGMPAPNVR